MSGFNKKKDVISEQYGPWVTYWDMVMHVPCICYSNLVSQITVFVVIHRL